MPLLKHVSGDGQIGASAASTAASIPVPEDAMTDQREQRRPQAGLTPPSKRQRTSDSQPSGQVPPLPHMPPLPWSNGQDPWGGWNGNAATAAPSQGLGAPASPAADDFWARMHGMFQATQEVLGTRIDEVTQSFDQALSLERQARNAQVEKVREDTKQQFTEVNAKLESLSEEVNNMRIDKTAASSNSAPSSPPLVTPFSGKERNPMHIVFGSFGTDESCDSIQEVGMELIARLPQQLQEPCGRPFCPSARRSTIGKWKVQEPAALVQIHVHLDKVLHESPSNYRGKKIWTAVERHPSIGACRRVLQWLKESVEAATDGVNIEIDNARMTLLVGGVAVLHLDRITGSVVKRKEWDAQRCLQKVDLAALVRNAVVLGTVIPQF